jgi:hypothetical protein
MTNEEKNKLMSAFSSSIVEGIQAQLLALPSAVKGKLVDALDQFAAQLETSMDTANPLAACEGELHRGPKMTPDGDLSKAENWPVPEGNAIAIAIAIEEAKRFLPSIPDADLTAEMYRRGLMPVTRS